MEHDSMTTNNSNEPLTTHEAPKACDDSKYHTIRIPKIRKGSFKKFLLFGLLASSLMLNFMFIHGARMRSCRFEYWMHGRSRVPNSTVPVIPEPFIKEFEIDRDGFSTEFRIYQSEEGSVTGRTYRNYNR